MIKIQDALACMRYMTKTVIELNIETDLESVKLDENGNIKYGNYIIRKSSDVTMPNQEKHYYVAIIENRNQSLAKGLGTLLDAIKFIDENYERRI